MCRLLGWLSRTPVSARDVLGDDGLAAFRRLSRLHADGWGRAADDGFGPVLDRSTTRADDDPEFVRAMEQPTRAAVVHLRWATPGLPVQLRNTHPFLHGGRAFAHNGAIYPVDRVVDVLTAPWRDRLQGTTDSERYFLAVLAELEVPGTDVPTAYARVTARLAQQFRPSSLNSLLLAPEALYAVSCYDPAAAPPAPEAAYVEQSTYFDLRYRATPDFVVVASSGFLPPEAPDWQRLPNGSVLVVDRATLAVRQVSMDVRLGRPPLATSLIPAAGAD